MTNEITLSSQFVAAVALANEVKAMAVNSAEDHALVESKRKQARAYLAELETQYKAHPLHAQFKELQAQKIALEKLLNEANTEGKRNQLAYEAEQESIRLKAEAELQARMTAEAEEAALSAAVQLENDGDRAGANQIIESPFIIPAVILPKNTPTTKSSKSYRHRITDENLVPRKFCKPDDEAIKKNVKANGANTNIPGVEVYPVIY